jgi:hypothetical protein
VVVTVSTLRRSRDSLAVACGILAPLAMAAVLAAVSAAAWFDFFLTQPYERFSITHRTDIETTVLLLVVGVAVTELAVRARRQRYLADSEAAYLAYVRATTASTTNAGSPSTAGRPPKASTRTNGPPWPSASTTSRPSSPGWTSSPASSADDQ